MPRLTYKEIGEIVHLVKDQRTVLMGYALLFEKGTDQEKYLAKKLFRIDGKSRLIQDRLMKLIENHDNEVQ